MNAETRNIASTLSQELVTESVIKFMEINVWKNVLEEPKKQLQTEHPFARSVENICLRGLLTYVIDRGGGIDT